LKQSFLLTFYTVPYQYGKLEILLAHLNSIFTIYITANSHILVELSCYAMQAPREVKLLLIIDVNNRWGEWSAPLPTTLYSQGKDPEYPFDWRMSGRQSWSGYRRSRK
jgi:hypothetical protein